MALTDYKITDGQISTSGVSAAPDKLTGTTAENKAVFDRLIREAVKPDINSLIDELAGTGGAGDIGVTVITGVTGANVQAVCAALKVLIDACETSANSAAALSLKEDKTDAATHITTVTFNANDGKFTFTHESGSTTVIDTALEKVATNWAYDAATQSLVLTLADGSTQSVSLSAFITETEFLDSDQIDFSVSDHVVTATIKAGSITDAMLSSALAETLAGYVATAGASATAAAASEANALTYKNAAQTAKTDAEAAQDAAESAQIQAATSAINAAGGASSALSSAGSASTSADTATTKAGEASTSAANAASSADTATTKAGEAAASAGNAATSEDTATTKASEASTSAANAANSADTATTKAGETATSATNAAASAGTATTKAGEASTSAENAAGAASTATDKATLAESWAVGGTASRTGEDTNNAKYWSDAAQAAAGGGVTSFNGRTGAVIPQNGDYTAEMVGALAPAGDGSGLTETYTEAGTRANIATGESHATIFGKIKKWFTDLKTVAFTGSYADLSDTPVIPDELADLLDDSSHRTVTDAEKSVWNGKQDALDYVYVCTGTDDNKAICDLVNAFMGATGTFLGTAAMTMKLVVTGTLVISSPDEYGAGTETSPYAPFLFTHSNASREAEVFIDWSNAEIPQIVHTTSSMYNAGISCLYPLGGIHNAGLNINVTSTRSLIYTYSIFLNGAGKTYCEGCYFRATVPSTVGSYGAFIRAGIFYADDCVFSGESANNGTGIYVGSGAETVFLGKCICKGAAYGADVIGTLYGDLCTFQGVTRGLSVTGAAYLSESHNIAIGDVEPKGVYLGNLGRLSMKGCLCVGISNSTGFDGFAYGLYFNDAGFLDVTGCHFSGYIPTAAGEMIKGYGIWAAGFAALSLYASINLQNCNFRRFARTGYKQTTDISLGTSSAGVNCHIMGCVFYDSTVSIEGSAVTYLTASDGKYMPQYANSFGMTES